MAQRAGVGSALLQDFVAVADAADLPCYLESTPSEQAFPISCLSALKDDGGGSSKERRAAAEALYRRFGFVNFGGRVSCGPGDAMVLQPMRRPAKSECVLFCIHPSNTYRIF